MIIQCDKCSTKFRLDDSRVTGNGVRVRCTKCQNVFIVAPPPPVEEVGVEEVLGGDQVSSGAFETASKRPAPPARRPLDDYNLKFDFGRPSGKDAGEREESSGESHAAHPDVPPAAPAEKKPVSFDEIDFSFSTDRSAGKPFDQEGANGPAFGGPEETPKDGSGGMPAEDSQKELAGEGPEEKPEETLKKTAEENPLNGPWDTGFGLTGGVEGETREVPEDWEIGAAVAQEKPPFSDLDFGTGEGEDKDEGGVETVSEGGWSIGTAGRGAEKGPGAGHGAAESRTDTAVQGATGRTPAAYGSDGRPVEAPLAPQTPEEKPVRETLKFSQYFSEEMEKEEREGSLLAEVEESEGEEEDSGQEIPSNASSGRALMIAALIFFAGGAVIYFSGIIDTLAKRFMPPAQVAVQKTVDIETIKGYYAENKNFGKFFVVEATIKNISGEPQGVRAVTGLLYNAKGVKIAARSVAPGRVVSAEDLKNLSKEDLLKPFKDPSGGTLPPKGTVPVMIPFTDPPEGVSEYGIDIIR